MKAVLLTGHRGPEKLEYREDVSAPEPAAGELLVEGGADLNNTDLWMREGAYGVADDPNATGDWRHEESMHFPRIQGADMAGQIVAVAESRTGEQVFVDLTLYAEEGDGPVGLG